MNAAVPSIRLVIVDDSDVVRAGLKALLHDLNGISVIGEAGDVRGALSLCQRLKPDVALLDIRLPDGSGIDVCRQLTREINDTRVLFLTSNADQHTIDEAIRAGAHGYLLKEINAQALIQAIRDVAAGQSILDPQITARVLELVKTNQGTRAMDELSPQENRVLAQIAQGQTNKEVANELGLSEKTVKNYLSNIFDKLHITRRSQAAVFYAQSNRTPPGPNAPKR